ncbi:phospholipase D-like domain-containing protein [Halobacillus sp. A1]|uniref:phospholipase D-like domain-containing protein n=1 Tax=Halobacillus sp. A1 TaxID=2880262 RepID=UPI0020A67975|nr:phospholipase D-like domain-containing protein [Halobacillus sp. A1]MCP3031662.1 phospholipase D-like domain-containing protein [Halobacillus sp. A1]
MDAVTVASTIVIGSMAIGIYTLHWKTKSLKEAKLDYIFSKSNKSPKKRILRLIDQSKKSLDVAIFLLTEEAFVSHIVKASKRGVNVRVITDITQTNTLPAQKEIIQQLIDSGVPVKVNYHEGNMHLKVMVSDKKTVTTGSYNFTKSAENKNDEILVTIKSKEIAKEWSSKFEHMWKDEENYGPLKRIPLKKDA